MAKNGLGCGVQFLENELLTIPESPGIYKMIDSKDQIIYVGKAKNLKKRVHSYTQPSKLPIRLQRMVARITRVEVITTKSEVEALLLECNLIKKERPPFNILLKDDKSFPYILLSKNHPFPRLLKHRGEKIIEGDYFGPFASSEAVDESMVMVQKIFQLRTCSDYFFSKRMRPCLKHYIKQCSAPCVNKIEGDKYRFFVKEAKRFLLGKSDIVQKTLSEQMEKASSNLLFEEAAFYRDRLKLLSKIQARQRINVADLEDADVIALDHAFGRICVNLFFFRNGQNLGSESFFLTQSLDLQECLYAFLLQFYKERTPAPLLLLSHQPYDLPLIQEAFKKLYGPIVIEIPKIGAKRDVLEHALSNAKNALERHHGEHASQIKIMAEISSAFSLKSAIERIECYDNSHLMGTDPYGVMIVATTKGFDKSSYRKFSLPLSLNGDDYLMMEHVLKRRLSHLEWKLPDMFLIDGGKIQLQAAHNVLKDTGIPIIAIAKGEKRNAGQETFFMQGLEPFQMPENSSILYFLQRIRDEAHRFAIGMHRAKRQKKITQSALDSIQGIGRQRKKILLNHFGSVHQIAQSDVKDLSGVNGIDESLAKKIYAYFHG